jgi:hypothetical protein
MFKSSNLLEEKEEENKRSSPLFLTKPSNLETSSRSTNFDISSEEEMFEKRGRTRRITGDYGGTYNPSRS